MAIYEDAKILNTGKTLYISGQTPAKNDTVPAEVGQQLAVIIEKIDEELKKAGLSVSHLVKVTILITDRTDLPIVREKLAAYFGDSKPAATLAVVSGFIDERFKVEIDAVAGFNQ